MEPVFPIRLINSTGGRGKTFGPRRKLREKKCGLPNGDEEEEKKEKKGAV